ncbi:hypothetical protein D3C73_1036580 [compost metagenome]
MRRLKLSFMILEKRLAVRLKLDMMVLRFMELTGICHSSFSPLTLIVVMTVGVEISINA